MPAHPPPTVPIHTREPVGTFVKPGPDGEPVERVAWTPSHAVALTFDGWQPKTETPAPVAAADAAGEPSEARPRSGASTKTRGPAHPTGPIP